MNEFPKELDLEQRRRAVELEEEISFDSVYDAAAEIIWSRDEIARLKSTYESAVRGRQEFREAYRHARDLLNRFVVAWEKGGENMDRLCELARSPAKLASQE